MNMKRWLSEVIASPQKKPLPILSFPSVSLLGVTVREITSSGELQARGMAEIAKRCDTLAAVSMMDLSVEAEAFGATVRFSDGEVPAVTGALLSCYEDAEALAVPPVTAGRCPVYTDAIARAKELITDRPVFAGVIGPFSLAGRLMGVSEVMINCYDEPEFVEATLEKATKFLISYINEFKKAGANGVMMAEPLTGMLSPALAAEFSQPFVRRIVDAVQDDEFIVIYHNCGNNIALMANSILATNAAAFHFGNAVPMRQMLDKFPSSVLILGNIDPASQIRCGTPKSVSEETKRILSECSAYKNFVISSGCDIPPDSPWENIDAVFSATKEFYNAK